MRKTTLLILSTLFSVALFMGASCQPRQTIQPVAVLSEAQLIENEIASCSVMVMSDTGTGSGVVIEQDKKHALIITANHVIRETKKVHIRQFFNDFIEFEEAKIIWRDVDHDLALVETKPVWLGTAKLIKDPSDIVQFSKAFTYGYPGTIMGPVNGLLTEGRISILHDTSVSDRDITITSIPVFFGNSGGGLFINKDGHFLLAGIAQCMGQHGHMHPTYIFHIGGFCTGEQLLDMLKAFHAGK